MSECECECGSIRIREVALVEMIQVDSWTAGQVDSLPNPTNERNERTTRLMRLNGSEGSAMAGALWCCCWAATCCASG